MQKKKTQGEEVALSFLEALRPQRHLFFCLHCSVDEVDCL